MGLVQEESFLHTPASGNREITVEEVENARGSGLKPAAERARKNKEQASSSVPTGKGQTDDKRSQSPEARPATKAENSLSIAGKMKNIVV